MRNNETYYEEFNVVNADRNAINFISKTRAFFEKHIGVTASRIGSFFRKIGRKTKEKFTIPEKPLVREPIVNEAIFDAPVVERPKLVENTKNKIMSITYNMVDEIYAENVALAHQIDRIIKENSDIDFEDELDKLKKAVYEIKDAKLVNNYAKLSFINKKLKALKIEVTDKKNSIVTRYTGFDSYTTEVTPLITPVNKPAFTSTVKINTDAKPAATSTVNVYNGSIPKVTVKPVTKKEETSVKSNVSEYELTKEEIRKIDEEIAKLQAQITKSKSICDEYVRNIELINDETTKLLDSRAKSSSLVDRKDLLEKISELYDEVKDADEEEEKIETFKASISSLEEKKAELRNKLITVDMPNSYAKNGYLTMKMTIDEYEAKMKEREVLDKQITLLENKETKESYLSTVKDALKDTNKELRKIRKELKDNSSLIEEEKTLDDSDSIAKQKELLDARLELLNKANELKETAKEQRGLAKSINSDITKNNKDIDNNVKEMNITKLSELDQCYIREFHKAL